MKFIALGTLIALLCFYAYTEDDNDLNREDIDLELEEDFIDQSPKIENNQNDKLETGKVDESPQSTPQEAGTAQEMSTTKLIVQDIVPEKDKRRSESVPKEQKNSNSNRQNPSQREQRRTSMSQQPSQNRTNGRKQEQRVKVNVKTPTQQPKTELKNNEEAKNKQKQKFKAQKAPKQAAWQFPKGAGKNSQQAYKNKGYPKKEKPQQWYSSVLK